jgi:hypothetical protein
MDSRNYKRDEKIQPGFSDSSYPIEIYLIRGQAKAILQGNKTRIDQAYKWRVDLYQD